MLRSSPRGGVARPRSARPLQPLLALMLALGACGAPDAPAPAAGRAGKGDGIVQAGGELLCSMSQALCLLEPGAPIGRLWNTYYYLADEADHDGDKRTALYDARCRPLATVAAGYADSICVEGSGRLADGRVLNFATSCSCGRRCPTGGTICYEELSPREYPWGRGAGERALEPLRSIAVDRSRFALGRTIYLAAFDGLELPDVDGVGGYTHDGCFRADDVGGWIKGQHIDIFTGTSAMRRALEGLLPTESRFEARAGGPRCEHIAR